MTDTTSTECLEDLQTQKWFEHFEVTNLILQSFLFITSFYFWFKYGNNEYTSLRFRGIPNVMVLYLSWITYLITGPITMLFPETSSKLGCFLFNVFALASPSLLQFGVYWRLLKWYKFLQYNELSSEQFSKEAKIFYSSKMKHGIHGSSRSRATSKTLTKTESEKVDTIPSNLPPQAIKLHKLKFFLSDRGAKIQAITGCVIIFCFSMVIAAILCKTVLIHVKTKEIPDPSGIFQETKIAISFPLLLSVIRFIFDYADVLKDLEENMVSPSGLLIDIAFLMWMLILVVLPLRVIFQKSLSRRNKTVSLKQVLKSTLGEKLFRAYVIYEFSIENLNFYLVAKKWEEEFESIRELDRKRRARNIISRWIQDLKDEETSTAKINISYEMRDSIVKKYFDNSISRDLFSEAVKEVYNLMSFDTFARFQRSVHFKELYGVDLPETEETTI
eukprot:snap_masked-scaffold_31-processed-gene-3.18-mRNA-1 protein AED:1.00 eAED:1.00 QI:0/0/0/0/1/1/2/0/444